MSAPPSSGDELKRVALDRLAARRRAFVQRGQRALLLRLLVADTATADDVRAVVELPPGVNPKLFGVVPRSLADAGIIVAVGFTSTDRPQAHARPIRVWRLADRAAAHDWLAAHPETLDAPSAEAPPGCLF